MNQEHIDFLLNVKTQFKNGNIKFIKKPTNNDIDLNNIDLYEEITSYILYLWYSETSDNRITERDYIIIPNNIEKTFSFNNIDYLNIAKILAYIKYDLLSGILDKLTYETFNKKNLNKYKTAELKKIINEQNITIEKKRITKNQCIQLLLENKDSIFNTNEIDNAVKTIVNEVINEVINNMKIKKKIIKKKIIKKKTKRKIKKKIIKKKIIKKKTKRKIKKKIIKKKE